MKTTTIIFVPKRTHIACLDDYHPVALTPVITQCLERLIPANISDCLPPSFNSHQFAYKANRSTEDSISIILHTALSHLEHRDRVLFVDFSSACNTIIPNVLVRKLSTLGLHPLTCLWIKDFLTDRPPTVKLELHLSSTHTLSTGSPQGCVLYPLIFTLYFRPVNANNTIAKFADDTTVVGLIAGRDESAYRDEVLNLSTWCQAHNLIFVYRSTVQSILLYCNTVWFPHCTEAEAQRFHRMVRTAEKIISCPLPSLKDIHTSCCLSRAQAITKDCANPAFHVFDLLPFCRHYRSIKTRTKRFRGRLRK